MSLAQVARHGGEISRQLNDLADAVGNQRNTKVEEKIKKLELEATGPVALVFVGFMIILLIGFGLTNPRGIRLVRWRGKSTFGAIRRHARAAF